MLEEPEVHEVEERGIFKEPMPEIHMSHSPNSSKKGYIGDSIGEYCRGCKGGARSLAYSLDASTIFGFEPLTRLRQCHIIRSGGSPGVYLSLKNHVPNN